jgi:putative DNA primase/helicase
MDWGLIVTDNIHDPISGCIDASEVTISTDKMDNPLTEPIRTDDEAVTWLATLKPMEYDRVRKEQANLLNVKIKTLDTMVKNKKADNQQDDSPFADIELWHEPIDPAHLLDVITATILRFIVLDKPQAQAAALWVSACWFVDDIQCAPILLINAPERACGKTQLLTLLAKLAPRPLQASGISSSALYRVVEKYKPTLFIDEIETVLKDNEELRGLLNAGHTRDSAYVIKCVGDDHEPTKFSVWGMKAVAGINAIKLAETITSRSIVIELRRKKSDETITRLRHAEPDLFNHLASKLARFADDYIAKVRDSRPHLPDELGDRDQDNWEPLLQVAAVAGGHWLDTATKAALKLSGASHSTQSTGNELLADIQTIFECNKTLKIATAELIKALCEDTEAPWATYNQGKELSARQLSNKLAEYGISSKTIRLASNTAKGFEVEQFNDAFTRYLSDPLNLPLHANNSLEANNGEPSSVTDDVTVTKSMSNNCDVVTDSKTISNRKVTLAPLQTLGCDVVTDKMPILEGALRASNTNDIARF